MHFIIAADSPLIVIQCKYQQCELVVLDKVLNSMMQHHNQQIISPFSRALDLSGC